jgi:arylsulfatase A-like enzyme
MTGLHPRTHQIRDNGAMLPEQFVTLPQKLTTAGYETGAFLSNMCDAPNRGLSTLFCAWWEESGPPAKRTRREWLSHDQPKWDAAITREAITFMRKERKQPFFAWVHYIDPHKPFDLVPEYARDEYDGSFPVDDDSLARLTLAQTPPTPAQRRQLLAIYDSQVSSTDAHIGAILTALQADGLADNTLVVFTADHGEELGDHNAYYYHLSSVYQQVLSVPLILRWPGRLPADLVTDAPIAAVDIAPTLLELLGLAAENDSMEGESRAGLARQEAGATGAATTFSEWRDRMVIVGQGNWRYIWNPDAVVTYGLPFKRDSDLGFSIAPEELYDLAADPLQQENVAAAYPEKTAALKARACAFVTEQDFHRSISHQLSPESEERLKSLGYLQGEEETSTATSPLSDHCPAKP